MSASHRPQVSANAVLASSSVAQNPCDGRRGATTAPVIVHIQGRSCGALLLRKIRPTLRLPSNTSQSSGLPGVARTSWGRRSFNAVGTGKRSLAR
jgi:hypothetical protein